MPVCGGILAEVNRALGIVDWGIRCGYPTGAVTGCCSPSTLRERSAG
jgi:hypothetical protein